MKPKKDISDDLYTVAVVVLQHTPSIVQRISCVSESEFDNDGLWAAIVTLSRQTMTD